MSEKQSSNEECENCHAKHGAKSEVEPDTTVNVRMFHGKILCSDCIDALCYAWEN